VLSAFRAKTMSRFRPATSAYAHNAVATLEEHPAHCRQRAGVRAVGIGISGHGVHAADPFVSEYVSRGHGMHPVDATEGA
jgi:hypothetical protein